MSAEQLELVRQGWDAFSRGDMEAMRALCQPDVQIVQPAEVPGAQTYEGYAGMAESIEDWPRQWEDFRLEIAQLIDLGDDRVLAVTRQHGRGRASGIELDFEVTFVHTVRDGKLSRLEMFLKREQAFESVGLTE